MSLRPIYLQIRDDHSSRQSHPGKPCPKPSRKPLFRLELRDLSAPGAKAFLSELDCESVLEEAVDGVLSLLYPCEKPEAIPPTRSVTLILRSFAGVAYTTGRELDDDHKEIHFSTDYIEGVAKKNRKIEMLGVIRHEMVHCWQWAANGTCPGGLIEGMADYVRLRSNLAAPHWKQKWDCEWDVGYERTGYFLDYLERRFGHGTVMTINDRLRNRDYHEEDFWNHCCGYDVKTLWKQYAKAMDQAKEDDERLDPVEGVNPSPTCISKP